MDLFDGILSLTIWNVIMFAIAGTLIWLAVVKGYEPMLLLPIGFGAIMANIPLAAVEGLKPLEILRQAGIGTELFPLLIFTGVGAMIDFGPLLKNPKMLLFGGAAQFGIFFTLSFAVLMGFSLKEAAAIGIIGAADGPTSIFVANKFAEHLVGPITVAAYTYMALVPIIQPPVIRLLTTKEERKIRMDYFEQPVSKKVKVLFPILVTFIAGIIAPNSVSLVGFLMFGNLLRESGVTDRLSKAAQNELASVVTILLGITIGSTMTAESFLNLETLMIISMGLIAFIFDSAGGIIFAKVLNLFSKNKINPMIGAAGISAFPMSARVIQREAQLADPTNFILMHAVSANVGGQIASIVAGGLILALVG
ncbi:MAG: sodium ion-translocating decarboxylase subunit beta [Lutisporaceae bacterium]